MKVDLVDRINDEFDEFQEELMIRNKKLKLLVGYDIDDDVISLLNEIKDKGVIF